jgi:hypothetical protein
MLAKVALVHGCAIGVCGWMQGRRLDGRVLSAPSPMVVETDALQIQPRPPSQDPEGPIPRDELARIRCGSGPAGRPPPSGSPTRRWRRGMRPATGERGGQPIYSDIAIETGLALRLVLHQPLRQIEGALRAEPLSEDVSAPGLCPINGPRRRSVATY